VDLLNAGVHPVLPGISSVGAGDLPAMAYVAQVAIGTGRAEYRGEVLPGNEALARAGLRALALRPKDGLALVSVNGISVGSGALVLARARRLAALADVAVALSMEATRGNPSIVLPAVAAAKPFPGLVEACRRIRAALEGSFLLAAGAPASVQDPLSFRVAPQVHGAYRDTLAFAADAVEGELNAQTDNPLVDAAEGRLVSNGNFHPVLLAVAFDALRVAVAHVGQLADRRLNHLWDAFFAVGLGDGPPPELPGLSLRYPAAAAAGELRGLAAPVSLDIGVLELGVEDHSTAAPLAVRRTGEALDLLADVLTVELLLAADVLDLRRERPSLGRGTGIAYRAVRSAAAGSVDRSPDAIHRAVRGAVDRQEIAPAAG
jgi:histidine ammonia-lyase